MIKRLNDNKVILKNKNFNCCMVLNEKQTQKRCIEYKMKKLFSPYKKQLEELRLKINDELLKVNEAPAPKNIYYNFIYFVILANDENIKDEYINWYKENFIFNQYYYKNKESSYCVFLELEYKYRKEYIKFFYSFS